MCVYFCDFYSYGIPVPMVTYIRQELFACTNAIVSGGKSRQDAEPDAVAIGPVSGSRYMARLRAIGADLGTGH